MGAQNGRENKKIQIRTDFVQNLAWVKDFKNLNYMVDGPYSSTQYIAHVKVGQGL